MNKVLSICIPSYNMEGYLNRCVDSLIVDEILDKLEIIIVNDGSNDRTLEIANDYQSKYPKSIIVIDKENGHYGSCVNAALKIATGKYFRVLDADDWVNSNVLSQFISKLDILDVDVVFNKYVEYYAIEKEYKNIDFAFKEYNRIIDLSNEITPIKWFFIHSITYNLNFLHAINYSQTEGICYTDNEYTFIPISRAKNMYLTDVILVNYFIGRNEQSISTESKRKNTPHFVKVLESIMYSSDKNTNINYNHLKPSYIFDLIEHIIPNYLLDNNLTNENIILFRDCIKYLNETKKESYLILIRNKIIKLWYNKNYIFRILRPILKRMYNSNNA